MAHIIDEGQSKINEDTDGALTAHGVDEDIAIICYNRETQWSGMCRSCISSDVLRFMNDMMRKTQPTKGVLEIRLIGGVDSEASALRLKTIVNALVDFDAERNIVNIVSADILGKPHPHSFAVSIFDGAVEITDVSPRYIT